MLLARSATASDATQDSISSAAAGVEVAVTLGRGDYRRAS